MPLSAVHDPAARRYGWSHWAEDRCPACGRGISERYRGVPHPVRVRRRALRNMSRAYRAALPECRYIAPEG